MKEISIFYRVSIPKPESHYLELSLELKNIQELEILKLKMPTWTPGSYLLREYERFLENLQVFDKEGNQINFQKIRKNIWQVAKGNLSEIKITYKIYAFDLTVRTNHVDSSHAYFNPAAVFLYEESLQNEALEVKIIPPENWNKIDTGLAQVKNNQWTRIAPNYDTLVDSPFEVGNQEQFSFEAAGVLHKVAIFNAPEKVEEKKLIQDFQKIIEASTAIFGEAHPCKNFLDGTYTFIIHFSDRNGGGLEHSNSCSLLFDWEKFQTEDGYMRFLHLVAHEYFHLWNVKCLRPTPLGAFDYDRENYTTLLWFVEGFTVYFEEIILKKSGIINEKEFLENHLKGLANTENNLGNHSQSLADASFDAWVKAYRPHENSSNTTVSYYTKGSMIAMLLDLAIIDFTNAEKSLEDLMSLMFQKFFIENNRAFTEEELLNTLKEITQKDFTDFFQQYIHQTAILPYEEYFTKIDFELKEKLASPEEVFLGIDINKDWQIRRVAKGSPADLAGLNAFDKILKIDGKEVEGELKDFLENCKIGQKLKVLVKRSLKEIELSVKLIQKPQVEFFIDLEENQDFSTKQKKWLRI